MPTSTVWRRSATMTSNRGVSPVRPSDDAIERISPEPSSPPAHSHSPYNTSSVYHGQSSIQGLGFSHTGLLDSGNNPRQSEELYIEHRGDAHVRRRTSDVRTRSQHPQSPIRDWSSRQSKQDRSYRSSKGKGHTRSGSTIDDLASAAIATSPTFANGNNHSYLFSGSPTSFSPTRPSTSHLTHFGYHNGLYEPPAKRVKSERLPATEWNNESSGSTTSHQQDSNIYDDVELLLGLKTEVNFLKQASPAAVPAQLHHSPVQLSRAVSPPAQTTLPKLETPSIASGQVDAEIASVHNIPASDETELIVNGTSSPERTISGEVQVKMDADSNTADAPVADVAAAVDYVGAVPAPEPAIEVKKTRRIKPQIQAEVCAECNKLQRETDDEDATMNWICCNGCNRWFHAGCVGFKGKAEVRSVDKFVCKQCEPEHGQTTFVRKSSRTRTAIDYGQLNQGLVKSSIETSMHHYIQPIKNGKFPIQKDDFARIRPEVLTVEFLENMDNMKRPFVVPARWNPRFGAGRDGEVDTDDSEEKRPEKRFDGIGTQLDPETDLATDVAAETVIDCDQDLLDMVMPRDLTVRKVAELYGSQELVPVIDVKSQETKGAWTLEQWADYYEDAGDKPIRNVISLEVSESRIGRLIRRPKVVRELDLEDQVWDAEDRGNQKKRPVQYYCLMSVADSYTDFHIDFGGSSVYYHILKGTKTFFFIPPEDRYLRKYEEWCNSQTQNETWLPDLCNGNVTRVDLHEGDTAFIPAGWIHSVWTPEDSLVIGGNFLTRIDYELQLKVANVEKVTKVAPKFRYPFFQKVMWYSLLKYLEEDPVPDEVLEDFQDDPEYTYLRANPVWHEIGDLANIAEPGSAEYNARYYPKTEIRGLLPLRDYLYRTARIYADLPVPDINKKQIEAVKNSIPKGHGDPLLLVKTFAIWCAWKIGDVTVPKWVYSDVGGFPELENAVKKADSVRLPGERSSLRRAAQNVAREVTGTAVITPYKPGLNAAGVNADPNKKAKPANHKPSGVRTACEACRKRRVRCPHKEGETSPGAQASTPISRSQSPAVALSVNGMLPGRATPIAPMPDGLPGLDGDQTTGYISCNLAQSALATIDPLGNDHNGLMPNGVGPLSGKKSRSKACEECRKSKRRCVHDEYGRVDPAKAAEPSKPRGSSSTKRPSRPSDESLPGKRIRTDSNENGEVGQQLQSDIDAMIDPALFERGTLPPEDPMQVETSNASAGGQMHHDTISVSPFDQSMADAGTILRGEGPLPLPTDATRVTVETVKQEPDLHLSTTAVVHSQDASIQPEFTMAATEANFVTPRTSTSPVQRHSSRQPKVVERYIPDDHRSPTKPQPKAANSERRGSSAASGQTMVNSLKSRRSSSNTSGTTHQIAAALKQAGSPSIKARQGSRGSTVESEDPDEKLARELQAEEHGLRRRQSIRL